MKPLYTPEKIREIVDGYDQGKPGYYEQYMLLIGAAESDTDAAEALQLLREYENELNERLYQGIENNEPQAIEHFCLIIEKIKRQLQITPHEEDFLVKYGKEAANIVTETPKSFVSNQSSFEDFLLTLTPKKVKSALSTRTLTAQDEANLKYTPGEMQILRTGTEAEKEEARAKRLERTANFFNSLSIFEMIVLIRVQAKQNQSRKAKSDDLPSVRSVGVKEYVTTKDLLTKAVFGEPGRNGKTLSLIQRNPGELTLWEYGNGINKKEVFVYTQLKLNEDFLKANGITIGKNLSKRARVVYGAMLSHYLAGNALISLGMMGELIFNSRDGNALTDNQKKYIIDGAKEIFGSLLYVNTQTTSKHKGKISLNEAQEVKIDLTEQLFPGRITSAYINGKLVETAIELFNLPTLYALQNKLQKGLILRVPTDMLKIPGRNDEDTVTIRDYLMTRINAMQNSNISRMIIYKNILDEVGVDPTDRAQRARRTSILQKVERILNCWVPKYISGYKKLNKNGKPATGTNPIYEIEILL